LRAYVLKSWLLHQMASKYGPERLICARCDRPFKIDDEVVSTATFHNHRRIWHARCFPIDSRPKITIRA
jgi:hypothetical protein